MIISSKVFAQLLKSTTSCTLQADMLHMLRERDMIPRMIPSLLVCSLVL